MSDEPQALPDPNDTPGIDRESASMDQIREEWPQSDQMRFDALRDSEAAQERRMDRLINQIAELNALRATALRAQQAEGVAELSQQIRTLRDQLNTLRSGR